MATNDLIHEADVVSASFTKESGATVWLDCPCGWRDYTWAETGEIAMAEAGRMIDAHVAEGRAEDEIEARF